MINTKHSLFNDTLPLVSCLCITTNRVTKLKRSINCFLSQTYPNKELIIVSLKNDNNTFSFLQNYNLKNILHVEIDPVLKPTLGELRNISIQNARGEYFCQWDDDDWYHPERLTMQAYAAFKHHHPASILTNCLIFDDLNKQAYFSFFRFWENSIFCKKDIITSKRINYPPLDKQEDTCFIDKLLIKSKIYPVVSHGLYIYVFHGENTWSNEHFASVFKKSQKLSKKNSQLINGILKEKHSHAEASLLLQSEQLLKEINFFYSAKQVNST